MKERPILFSGPMVKAILDGRKVQTRRVVKPQPNAKRVTAFGCRAGYGFGWFFDNPEEFLRLEKCPYREKLWVRETWRPWIESCKSGIQYRADGSDKNILDDFDKLKELMKRTGGDLQYSYGDDWGDPHPDEVKQRTDWRPSIHMPRWASRLTLEVTEVRVERVQDITINDIVAEGVGDMLEDPATIAGAEFNRVEHLQIAGGSFPHDAETMAFAAVWDSINGKKHPWASNPWVWAITFKRVEQT